jgi:hypothetical protein
MIWKIITHYNMGNVSSKEEWIASYYNLKKCCCCLCVLGKVKEDVIEDHLKQSKYGGLVHHWYANIPVK